MASSGWAPDGVSAISSASLVNVTNVEMVALAGGLAAAGDLIFELTRNIIMERGTVGVKEHVRIVPASLGDDAGIFGAARLARS